MLVAGMIAGVPRRVAWYRTISHAIDIDTGPSSNKKFFLHYRKKIAYKFATHFIANSKASARDLITQFHADSSKVVTFPNALADKRDKFNIPAILNRKELVYAGRIVRNKGLDTLIEAFRMIRERDSSFSLKIIGDGDLKTDMQRLVRVYQLEHHCSFLGSLANDLVIDHFSSSHVAVVPSLYEAFGIVAIEALMTGTPVVASRTGGLAEVIRDGRDGILVPPGDPEALAAAILRVFDDENRYREMCRNARQRFLEEYEVSKVVSRQADWLESLIAKP